MILTSILSLISFFSYVISKNYWYNLAMTTTIGILFEF